MPTIEGVDPGLQAVGTAVFVVAIALFTAWSMIFGRKLPAQRTTTTEFAVAGQLADMGPVRELIEQIGLLVQQQIRTAIAIEACAVSLTGVEVQVRDLLKYLREVEEDRDREEEIERRARIKADALVREADEAKDGRRRRTPGTTP